MFRRIRASLESRFYSRVNSMMIKRREAIEEAIPKFSIETKHVQKLRALADRQELVRSMPKDCVVAEVGVFRGDFNAILLAESKPRKLHLIDAWSDPRYPVSLMHMIEGRFKTQIDSGNVVINRGWSADVLGNFPDGYFDWVYLDSDHSYSATIRELEILKKKVKTDGIIAGHDFVQGAFKYGVRFGVVEAVSEFCVKNDWEIIFLSMAYASYPSFAIRAIPRAISDGH